jgi:hypothetical protein
MLPLEGLRIAVPGLKGAAMRTRLCRVLVAGAYTGRRCRLPMRLRDRFRSRHLLVAGSSRGIELAPERRGRLGCMGAGRSWLDLFFSQRGEERRLIDCRLGRCLEVVGGSCWLVGGPGRLVPLCLWGQTVSWVFGHSGKLDLRLRCFQVAGLQSSWAAVVVQLVHGLSRSGSLIEAEWPRPETHLRRLGPRSRCLMYASGERCGNPWDRCADPRWTGTTHAEVYLVHIVVVGARSDVHRLSVYRESGIERSVVYEHCSALRKMHLALEIRGYLQSLCEPYSGRHHGRCTHRSLYQSDGGMVKVFGLAL